MTIKNFTTPDFGGATDVTVIEILVKVGDQVNVDTPLMTLESDKATMELPSSDAGVIKEIKVKVGDAVQTGSVLLTIESGATATATPAAAEETKPAKGKTQKPVSDTQATKVEIPTPVTEAVADDVDEDEDDDTKAAPTVLTGTLESHNDVHAGPGVRRMARELGVDLSRVVGSGLKQRILKEDVQAFVKNQLTQVQTGMPMLSAPSVDFSKFGLVEFQSLSRIKKISGKNLQRNWMMIPHVTQFAEADITTLEEFRVSQKAALDKEQVKLTPLVFIMKAVVASLKAFPNFNASLDASGENLVLKKYFNLGVAVDTPDGLVVPVIRDVDKKGLIDLAKELATVSEKARKKQLTPNDMQGGCFSISSLGGIGGTAFTPIINAPEVAILGVSRSSYKPVYEKGAFVPRLMLPLSLSYDHRVIDGAEGARFVVHLTNMLADIRNLLM